MEVALLGLGTGMRNWLLQRLTAIILLAYIIFLAIYFMTGHPASYQAWQELFKDPWMRFSTFFALLSLFLHAWIGAWTVMTDYIKPESLSVFFQTIVACSLLGCIAWSVHILWGI